MKLKDLGDRGMKDARTAGRKAGLFLIKITNRCQHRRNGVKRESNHKNTRKQLCICRHLLFVFVYSGLSSGIFFSFTASSARVL